MNTYIKDETLLVEIKKGNDQYLKRIYLDMRSDFLMFISKYFGVESTQAIEIYPEVFTKFYYNIKDEKLEPPLRSSLKTYLFAIGKNIFLKKKQNAFNRKVIMDDSHFDFLPDDSLLEYYEYDNIAHTIDEILNNIGLKCKEILTLSYIEEKSTKEICQILNIENAGTIRKRKFDCLQMIRKNFPELINSLR